MFNVFGVIWVLFLFEPFLSMVDWIISDFMNINEAGGVAVSLNCLLSIPVSMSAMC